MCPPWILPSSGASNQEKSRKAICYSKATSSVPFMRTVCSQTIRSWYHQNARVESPGLPRPVSTIFTKRFWNLNSTVSRPSTRWATSGPSVSQDPSLKSSLVIPHSSLVKEFLTLCSHQFWEELVPFRERSDVVRHVFLKPCRSTPTVKSLFTLDAAKEVTRWLRSWKSSPSSRPSTRTARKSVSCKEHPSSPTLQTCPWPPERPVFTLVSHWPNISETWVETCQWWLIQHPDGPKPWEKSQVDLQKCPVIQVILLIWLLN